MLISGIVPAESSIFKSALHPLRLTFRTTNGENCKIIFKKGDDLRQDQLVIIQTLPLSPSVWCTHALIVPCICGYSESMSSVKYTLSFVGCSNGFTHGSIAEVRKSWSALNTIQGVGNWARWRHVRICSIPFIGNGMIPFKFNYHHIITPSSFYGWRLEGFSFMLILSYM